MPLSVAGVSVVHIRRPLPPTFSSSSRDLGVFVFPEPHRNEEQLIWLDLRELVGVAGYDPSNSGVATNGVARGVTAIPLSVCPAVLVQRNDHVKPMSRRALPRSWNSVWRQFPIPQLRCWITCRIFESVNDMFSNTFSNDLTVQDLAFELRITFGLTRKNLSEYHPSTLVADTNGVALGVTPRVPLLAFLPYSSSVDDYMRTLYDKILRYLVFFLPTNVGRQSLERASPRHGRSTSCTGQKGLGHQVGSAC